MSVRVGAVDCGTNSVKLLVVDLPEDPSRDPRASRAPQEVLRQGWMTRLGQDVDATGRLAPEALERTLDAVREIAGLVREHGCDRVRFVATSAARDASNGEEFRDGVREILGVEAEVVEGTEEAALSFEGAVRGLAGAGVDLTDPVLVVDIGGGSTELVLGTGGEVQHAVSLDVGSVRLTERVLRDDPPTPAQVEQAVDWLDELLGEAAVAAGVDVRRARTVVGVAGTVTTLAAVARGQETYDHDALHGVRLTADDVAGTTEQLLGQTVAQRTQLGAMHPGRADVIAAGALVLDRVARRAATAEVVVSAADVIDGIAWSLVGPPRP
ncbi:Ppx/GppA family phosphatase [Nocardioidaceae bacterium]|nr:Ppx/GppA family phosphatase [Nocardioidaceae bacterium]